MVVGVDLLADQEAILVAAVVAAGVVEVVIAEVAIEGTEVFAVVDIVGDVVTSGEAIDCREVVSLRFRSSISCCFSFSRVINSSVRSSISLRIAVSSSCLKPSTISLSRLKSFSSSFLRSYASLNSSYVFCRDTISSLAFLAISSK